MLFDRRRIALLLALVPGLLSFSGHQALAAYPERIIKIVVPVAPGGSTDAIARVLAQEMAKDLGASIIVENKPGASTIIGAQEVAAKWSAGARSSRKPVSRPSRRQGRFP